MGQTFYLNYTLPFAFAISEVIAVFLFFGSGSKTEYGTINESEKQTKMQNQNW